MSLELIVILVGAVISILTLLGPLVTAMLNNRQAIKLEELKQGQELRLMEIRHYQEMQTAKVEALHKEINGKMTQLLAAKEAESVAKQETANMKGKEEGAQDNQAKTDAINKWAEPPKPDESSEL